MRTRILVLLSLAIFMFAPPASAQDAASRGPRPGLEPMQVVEAMLLALKKNTDQGIAELYRFSSPANRERTGSLPEFRAMIREGFPDMLGHQAARAAPPLIDGDRAMVPVEVVGSDEELHRYVFVLSRQNVPECSGCWMADAVFSPDAMGPGEDDPDSPEDPEDDPATPPSYGA